MKTIHLGVPLVAALVLAACGSDDNNTSNTTSNLTIPFQAKAAGVDIACGVALSSLGTTADQGTIADFAFYVHDIKFKTSTGATVSATLEKNDFQDPQYGVALLDFQNKGDSCNGTAKPTNKVVYAKIEGIDPATISGMEFKVGVPAAANHHNANTSIAPYNRSGMFWNWQYGHKFMRLDVNPANKVQLAYDSNGSSVANTYFFHLGSTGCQGDPVTGAVVSCSEANRTTITLSQSFKVVNLTTSKVVLDYAKLMQGVNLNTDAAAPAGCMSGLTDVECPTIFNNLGMAYGTIPATAAQSVFSVAN